MKAIEPSSGLGERVYHAILDGICEGALAPGEHLVQEQLAARLGVSRQPVQQAMVLLKADGLVEEAGRRGLRVAPLDLTLMRDHYDIRGTLDRLAAGRAAAQAAADPAVAAETGRHGQTLLEAANAALARGDIHALIRHDVAFHRLVYRASGNPLVAATAEPHWRFLRRAMAAVLRRAALPDRVWREHGAILAAIVAGDRNRAERLAIDHVRRAARALTGAAPQAHHDRSPAMSVDRTGS